MPVFLDAAWIEDIAPYFGLATPLYPPLPTLQHRNILFLGWGADFEKEF